MFYAIVDVDWMVKDVIQNKNSRSCQDGCENFVRQGGFRRC